ncbi:cobalamin biosynthesis protein CbiG [Brevundimonas sp.]|uniref:cobalamin biosynthesis protein CbiG n=1 Tax=Brevundimonas sp. TaxID=1871086 RepID=UPI001D728954|nr:cobalamin biosynthesis protein CbiG [Brevundimonas sp.]MBL0948436.1 cobalamin biosynthesis protein CbiG [Brevundimonas sp.]
MARLFDAYLIADWTAAETRKLGDQSLWIGVAKRDVRFRLYTETHNVATRAEGEALIASLLADHRKRGDRVLVGFDFNLGYPVGTGQRLGLKDTSWRGIWDFIASNVVDKPDNTNNRYQVAAKMNRLMTDHAWPFWGAPAKQTQRWLTATKPPEGAGADIPEFRATERAAREGRLQPKSVWQMHGAGAVGGQTLVGIAAVNRLLKKLDPSAAVWPFGTGWRALDASDLELLSALVVEVWPSLFNARPNAGEFKDQAQVRVTAEAFANMDERGELASALAPPRGASDDLIRQVETEEGWILGVTRLPAN